MQNWQTREASDFLYIYYIYKKKQKKNNWWASPFIILVFSLLFMCIVQSWICRVCSSFDQCSWYWAL
jgi:hypothetical protein